MAKRVYGWTADNPDYMHLDLDDIIGFAYSTVDRLMEPNGAVDDTKRNTPRDSTVSKYRASIHAYEQFMQTPDVFTFLLSHKHNPASDEIVEDVVKRFRILVGTMFYATMLYITEESPWLTQDVGGLKHITVHKSHMIMETLTNDLTEMFRAKDKMFIPLGRHRPSHDLRVD